MESSSQSTTCCVVGAGPAGVMVSYLLAQQGIDVLLLEAHEDFDRDFRGDTIHAGVMEALDEMGLADELLQLPHTKMEGISLTLGGRAQTVVNFACLKSRFPYVTMMPQSQFLDFIVAKAKLFSSFEIQLGAKANALIGSGDKYDLRYRKDGVEHLVKADLIVGADGRNSRIRRELKIMPQKSSVPMDVIWFRVPRKESDGIIPGGYVGQGQLLFVLERTNEWQVGFVFLHGTFGEIKSHGIGGLKEQASKVLPGLKDSMADISNWNDVAVLKVESSRLKKWHDRNVLLIGDSAHVMSPVGGVGINYAIQDALVAAGVVSKSLLAMKLQEHDLAKVQKKRAWPICTIQFFQSIVQRRIIKAALQGGPIRVPWLLRFKPFQGWLARLISHGLFKVEVPKQNRKR